MPADVVMYRTRYCGYCLLAKRLLAEKGIVPREIDVSGDREARRRLLEATSQRTVPQIYINARRVGGYAELARLEAQGDLDALLAEGSRD